MIIIHDDDDDDDDDEDEADDDDDDDDDDTLVSILNHNRCRPYFFIHVSRVALDPIGDAEGA